MELEVEEWFQVLILVKRLLEAHRVLIMSRKYTLPGNLLNIHQAL